VGDPCFSISAFVTTVSKSASDERPFSQKFCLNGLNEKDAGESTAPTEWGDPALQVKLAPLESVIGVIEYSGLLCFGTTGTKLRGDLHPGELSMATASATTLPESRSSVFRRSSMTVLRSVGPGATKEMTSRDVSYRAVGVGDAVLAGGARGGDGTVGGVPANDSDRLVFEANVLSALTLAVREKPPSGDSADIAASSLLFLLLLGSVDHGRLIALSDWKNVYFA
jgi:hypothetical protein